MVLRDFPKLPPRQEKALAALLAHGTVRAAAAHLGASEATLFRYLQDPAFGRAYQARRTQAVDEALAVLQRTTMKAVLTLAAVMDDEDAPASSRVTAARATLELSIQAVELQGLRAEVEEIKRLLSERERKGPRRA